MEIGQIAPNFALEGTPEAPLKLTDALRRGPAILLFVREFTCPVCQQHARQLARRSRQIEEAGGQVLIIGGGDRQAARRYARTHQIPYPVLADPDRTVYQAYGLDKAFLGLVQRSASLIIDRDRTVRYARLSTDPRGSVDIEELLGALAEVTSLGGNHESHEAAA